VLSVFGIELSSVLDSEHLRMEIEETPAVLKDPGFAMDPWIGFLI